MTIHQKPSTTCFELRKPFLLSFLSAAVVTRRRPDVPIAGGRLVRAPRTRHPRGEAPLQPRPGGEKGKWAFWGISIKYTAYTTLM